MKLVVKGHALLTNLLVGRMLRMILRNKNSFIAIQG